MKLKEFQSLLKKAGIGLAIFYNGDAGSLNANMYYFSGYDGIGIVAVPKNKKKDETNQAGTKDRQSHGRNFLYVPQTFGPWTKVVWGLFRTLRLCARTA